MRIALAQLNPVVGDIDGNTARMEQTLVQCQDNGADLVVFPELYLTGYPPRDLLERDWFAVRVRRGIERLREISAQHPRLGIIVGLPWQERVEGGLTNCAVVLNNGEVIFRQAKTLLPEYDVFDEARYFTPAVASTPFVFQGKSIGITICEDIWSDPALWPERKRYSRNPVADLAKRGASIIINISASPFCIQKERLRLSLLRKHARQHGVPLVYVNQVGANDELVFDGRSIVVDQEGRICACGRGFAEDLFVVDMDNLTPEPALQAKAEPPQIEAVYQALVLGIKDYLAKCGFSKAVVGLSGGIDSAVTCALAVAALGGENVTGIAMPTAFSSPESLDDAAKLAKRLGVKFHTLPIEGLFREYLRALGPILGSDQIGVTEENIQARIRGTILMAYSNKHNSLLLSTGNKSELAVGYCTLYGDMSGGLAVLADVPKTMVYQLAALINRSQELIPKHTITRPPSAELRPNQKDEDSLPPYERLDRILHFYIEQGLGIDQIVAEGLNSQEVEWVVRAVDRNEYKRKQAAPGLKVTSKAFGTGRRLPIAARLR